MARKVSLVFVVVGLLLMLAGGPARAKSATTWYADGPGTATVVSAGNRSDPEFSYNRQGEFSGEWTFYTKAATPGPVSIDYLYTGYHAFYNVRAYLRAFVTHEGKTTRADLVNVGPKNCCETPSGGFLYTGTLPLKVATGDAYGFVMGGSHGDRDKRLIGTLAIGKPSLGLALAPGTRTKAGEPATVTATGSLGESQAASFVPLTLAADLPGGLTLAEKPAADGWDCAKSTDTKLSCSTAGGRVAPGTKLTPIPLKLVSATKAEYTIAADFTGSWANNTKATTKIVFGNRPPKAVDDAAATSRGTAQTLKVTANDTDPDGDSLTVTNNTAPKSGTVKCAGDSCTYTPNPAFIGSDAFSYTVSDGSDGTATATATMTVSPPDTPVAAPDTATTPEETAVTVPVSANDVVGNEPGNATLETPAAHGTATCANSTCQYTPAANYTGTDSFNYTWHDADGQTSTAAVTVTVTPVNDPPLLGPLPESGVVGTPLAPLTASDPDGDTLFYRIVDGSLPAGVTLNLDGTFAGAPTAGGASVAQVQVCDPSNACDSKELRIQVPGVFKADAANPVSPAVAPPPPAGGEPSGPAPAAELPKTGGGRPLPFAAGGLALLIVGLVGASCGSLWLRPLPRAPRRR